MSSSVPKEISPGLVASNSRDLGRAAPDFSQPLRQITDLVDRQDFPQCALDQHINFGGSTGVVVAIVRQSLKIESPDGSTQSFNCNRLRTLYGARPAHSEDLVSRPSERKIPAPVPAPDLPRRNFIAEPDFTAIIQPITALAGHADFPRCAFGAHIDIDGHVGVVVELVKDSVKVQSKNGSVRSFNAPMLRKLYGTP